LEKTSPLSGRLTALLRESRLLLLVCGGNLFNLILYGYDRNDPAWSNSASDAVPHNSGGVFWCLVGGCAAVRIRFLCLVVGCIPVAADMGGLSRHIANSLFDRRALWVALIGFVVLFAGQQFIGSAAAAYPEGRAATRARRNVGVVLGDGWRTCWGLPCHLVSAGVDSHRFSLFSGLSWLRFTDRLGTALEAFYFWTQNAWLTWQDKRVGAQALSERQVVVEEEKKRVREPSADIYRAATD